MPWPADPQDMFKKYSFIQKLLNLSPALTDTKQNEQVILETVASDPEKKNDGMSFKWLNQWHKCNFLFFLSKRKENK